MDLLEVETKEGDIETFMGLTEGDHDEAAELIQDILNSMSEMEEAMSTPLEDFNPEDIKSHLTNDCVEDKLLAQIMDLADILDIDVR